MMKLPKSFLICGYFSNINFLLSACGSSVVCHSKSVRDTFCPILIKLLNWNLFTNHYTTPKNNNVFSVPNHTTQWCATFIYCGSMGFQLLFFDIAKTEKKNNIAE